MPTSKTLAAKPSRASRNYPNKQLVNPHQAAGQARNEITAHPGRRDGRPKDFIPIVNTDEVEGSCRKMHDGTVRERNVIRRVVDVTEAIGRSNVAFPATCAGNEPRPELSVPLPS